MGDNLSNKNQDLKGNNESAAKKSSRLQRESCRLRREFILLTVRKKISVSDEEVAAAGKKGGWTAHKESLKQDAKYFEENNSPVYRDKGKGKFILNIELREAPYTVRKESQVDEKEAIAQLAADFIRGADVGHSEGNNCVRYTRHEIIDMLKGKGGEELHPRIPETINKLEGIYEKYERLCCLDSGTTTLKVAELFNKQMHNSSLFDPSSRMRSLTILTNSNDIAKLLSDLNLQINVMMLGGRLRKETQAFVALAKSCLEAWNVYLDISMVGCVSPLRSNEPDVNGIRHFVSLMSDSLDEEEVKRSIFSRSQIRAVLIDSTKLAPTKMGMRGHYVFAEIHPNDVDVIITNSDHGIIEEINHCRKRGVAVLVARPGEKTIIPKDEKITK